MYARPHPPMSGFFTNVIDSQVNQTPTIQKPFHFQALATTGPIWHKRCVVSVRRCKFRLV
jgi:hypothetical protein